MATKPELKKQYKELVREGKTEEADKLLVSIQSFKSQIPEIEPVKKPEEKSKPAKDTKKSKEEFDSLLEIKGIGKETLKDIKKLYRYIIFHLTSNMSSSVMNLKMKMDLMNMQAI